MKVEADEKTVLKECQCSEEDGLIIRNCTVCTAENILEVKKTRRKHPRSTHGAVDKRHFSYIVRRE
jgi:hypothetical protein